ncbi:MAG: methylamine utilization protein [Proteobacteria bacterium]|nr:methylamine utilization protein [Pseudomonadota bacterium]
MKALILLISCGLLQIPCCWAGTLIVAVHTSNGRPLAGAVVTVHSVTGTNRPGSPVTAVMDQINRTFVPDLLVIPVGSTVAFPNSDSVSHQIYSFSPARRFQLPLYHGKPYPPVSFDQAGLVTLGCNIHDSMVAYVVVTDAAYFGRTDATGSWSVEAPPATYKVSVWQPRMEGTLEKEVTVAGERAELTIRLNRALKPAPLEARHSWDAY